MNIRTTSGFLAQFNVPSMKAFPADKGRIIVDENGQLADSCDIRLYIDSFYGDSLTTMKLRVQELSKENVLEEDSAYYTCMNVDKFIDRNGIEKSLFLNLWRYSSKSISSTYISFISDSIASGVGLYFFSSICIL